MLAASRLNQIKVDEPVRAIYRGRRECLPSPFDNHLAGPGCCRANIVAFQFHETAIALAISPHFLEISNFRNVGGG